MADVVGEAVLEVSAELTRDSAGRLRDQFGKYAQDAGRSGGDAGSKAFGSGFTSGVGKLGLGVALGNLITKGMGAVSSAIGSAVQRIDTLNNFPRVMENLGFSAEDAAKSVQTMDDRLQGLPTTIDQLTGATQRLASSPMVGSLEEATDVALAMNNALLAGGAPIANQSAAMEQYAQAVGRGQFELQEWKSLMTTMPGQLSQVAKSMLGAGASTDDLYQALRNGDLSIQDFNASIIDLDKNGSAGFASFADQALAATGGIATQFTNLQTSITRGLARIIEPLAPAISAALSLVTNGINTLSNAIGGAVTWFADTLPVGVQVAVLALGGLLSVMFPLPRVLKLVGASFKTLTAGFTTTAATAPAAAAGIASTGAASSAAAGRVTLLSRALAFLRSPLGLIGVGVAAAVGGFLLFRQEGESVGETFTRMGSMIQNFVTGVLPGLIQGFTAAIPEIVATITGLIPVIVDVIRLGLPRLIEGALQLFMGLVTGLTQAIPIIIEALVLLIPTILETLLLALPLLIEGALQLFLGIVQGLTQALPLIIESLLAMIPLLVETLMTALPLLIEGALQLFLGIVTGLVTALPQIISALLDMLPQLITTLVGMIPTLIEGALQLFLGIIQGIVQAIPQILTGLLGMLPKLISTLVSMIPQLITGALQLFLGIVKGLAKAIPDIVNALIEMAPQMVDALLEAVPQLVNAGVNLIGGVVEGLWNAASQIGSALLKIAQDAVGDFLSFFGMNSPSRLMMGYGENIGEGMANGIQAATGLVAGAMDDMSQAAVGSIDVNASPANPFPTRSTTSALPSAGGATVVNAQFSLSGADPRRITLDVMDELAGLVA